MHRYSTLCLFSLIIVCALIQTESLPTRFGGFNIRTKKPPVLESSSQDHYFEQIQDHGDATNLNTWQQRYFINQTFFDGDGPVFLCVGGEGPPMSALVVVTGEFHCGWMVVLAERHRALIVAVEHRFYGLSQPAPDLSTEYLSKYLSSEQALADLVTFRSYISELFGLTRNKWLTFGGSYPGMLAAWSRSKYPHLFYASVSSSAPIHAKANHENTNHFSQ
jgi:thymus-specific serine protease